MKKLKEWYKKSSKMTIFAAALIPYYVAWSVYQFTCNDITLGLSYLNVALLWFIILLAWKIIDSMTETSKISQDLIDKLWKALQEKDN